MCGEGGHPVVVIMGQVQPNSLEPVARLNVLTVMHFSIGIHTYVCSE